MTMQTTLTGPQKAALILLQLGRERSAPVLRQMNDDEIEELMSEVARLDAVHNDVMQDVLEQRLAGLAEAPGDTVAGGVQPLVDILNRADAASGAAILESLETTDPELADEIRRRMFVFQDIVKLDDRAVQLLLREIDTKDLAMALKGTTDVVRQKVLGNLSERAAA